ncbi:MAG: tetraacyldisaccharide 4'-kinase, partial [Pseudohongiellaceae bacterium]
MYSVQQSWYQNKKWLVLLWPLSLLFRFIAWLRRHFLVTVARKSPHPRPVVIIGNISVGGTGKTPLLIRLAGELTKAGLRPGIVSRGYGGKPSHYPLFVSPQSDPAECGDEALLIAQQTDCPLMVDPDRERAYQALCAQYECDVVLSDDGLQHYGLKRDIEVAVVDGQRLFGNGFCLPAGPLREPPKRLAQVQYVVLNDPPVDKSNSPYLQNAISMKVKPRFLVNLLSDEKKPFNGAPFNMGATIHAVSGIGNPDRFVALLESLPYNLQRHDFADHHS